jgi:hypothetical protein
VCVSTRVFAVNNETRHSTSEDTLQLFQENTLFLSTLQKKKKEPKLDVFVLDENGSKKRKTAFFLRTGKKGLKAVHKVTSSKMSKSVAQTGMYGT